MSESIFLIKHDELTTAIENYVTKKPETVGEGLEFKGFLICPSIDDSLQPAVYLNPVYGIHGSNGDGDVIIQNNSTKACPYPPGYGIN